MEVDPLAWEGKGELLKIFQDLHAFSDSLDLCKFSAFAEDAEQYAAQYAAAMGIPFTADDVMRTGERIYNLERHYNNLAGFGEGSDTPARSLPEGALDACPAPRGRCASSIRCWPTTTNSGAGRTASCRSPSCASSRSSSAIHPRLGFHHRDRVESCPFLS